MSSAQSNHQELRSVVSGKLLICNCKECRDVREAAAVAAATPEPVLAAQCLSHPAPVALSACSGSEMRERSPPKRRTDSDSDSDSDSEEPEEPEERASLARKEPAAPTREEVLNSERSEEVIETRRLVSSALADSAWHVGKVDDGSRREAGNASLLRFEDLAPYARLGHGLPTLRARGEFSRASSVDAFKSRFASADPLMAKLPYKSLGMYLAGGAVSGLLMSEDYAVRRGDFDLFLVGHTSSTAKAAIDRLGCLLAEAEAEDVEHTSADHCGCARCAACTDSGCTRDAPCIRCYRRRTEEPEDPLMVYQTQTCITFHSKKHSRMIQVVLRLYGSISEVIHGFDLGSCAMAWDGERLWFTQMGALAASHGANVANMMVRRNSYEHRIAKYFARGFDLVLPGLNMTTLRDLGWELPYLSVYVDSGLEGAPTECCPCHIWCSGLEVSIFRPRPGSEESSQASEKPAVPELPEGPYTANIPYGKKSQIRMRNFTESINPKGPNMLSICAYRPYIAGMDLSTLEAEYPDECELVEKVVDTYHHGAIKVEPLRRVLGREGAIEFARRLIESPKPRDEFSTIAREVVSSMVKRPRSALKIAYEIHAFDSITVRERMGVLGTTGPEWYGKAWSQSAQSLVAPHARARVERKSSPAKPEPVWRRSDME